jgi:hypothetical protein
MRRVYNLIMLCILLICQQDIVAQSYNLGKQKESFAYKTLYANHAQKTPVVKSNNETTTRHTQPIAIETIDTQPTQPMASVEEIHKEIAFNYCYGGIVFKKYSNIYKFLNQRQKDTLDLQKIQFVVLAFFESQKTAYPTLEKEIKNAISMDEEIAIFLSYYKEQ